MARDLPDWYKTNGALGDTLQDVLGQPGPVYFVAVRAEIDTGISTTSTHSNFYARGDFRPDALDEARRLVASLSGSSYDFDDFDECPPSKSNSVPIQIPSSWERRLFSSSKLGYHFKKTGLKIELGAYAFSRLAELVRDSWVSNPRQDEKGNIVLSRDEFIREFLGSYVDMILTWNGGCYNSPADLTQPPSPEETQRMLVEAGELHDKYISWPVGSLMVTKDFIFPYVIGRKQFPEMRQNRSDNKSCYDKGPRISTADSAVHLTGVDKDRNVTSLMGGSPKRGGTFRLQFGWSMTLRQETYVVPRDAEPLFIHEAIDSVGMFSAIWAQGTKHLPEGLAWPKGATKQDLELIVSKVLDIS